MWCETYQNCMQYKCINLPGEIFVNKGDFENINKAMCTGNSCARGFTICVEAGWLNEYE